MEQLIKKVIRASAGTGKTYRLSLEYIGLLLRFRQQGIQFSEILVITFTKKATAEIRENIFHHLQEIIALSEFGIELRQNLHSILGIQINDDDVEYLKSVYREMLLNKHRVQISTIDSFANMIFRTIIAPYLGLTTYEIDNEIDDELLAELYRFILEDHQRFNELKSFFLRSGRKNIVDYELFMKSILEHRWIFHLINESSAPPFNKAAAARMASDNLMKFKSLFYALLDKFQDYVPRNYAKLSVDQILKSAYYQKVVDSTTNPTISEIANCFKQKLDDETFIIESSKLFCKANYFWNRQRLFRKVEELDLALELQHDFDTAAAYLAEYILFKELLPEQQEIQHIVTMILERYDDIKFRTKIFTYSDISYYTFKYLYDPELSLIENDFVSNFFYEYLSSSIRFVLIDEFQDTSIIQFKILLPIIKEVISGQGVKSYGGAIIVGDEKQSIYGWRGGERDLLLHMPAIMTEAEKITLDTSYRSHPHLMTFINKLFSHPSLNEQLNARTIEWRYDTVHAHKKSDSGYVKAIFRNYSDSDSAEVKNDIAQEEDVMREFIEHELYPLIADQKISLQNTAILARKNKDLRFMASVLDELGIDYILESTHPITHHRAIMPVMYLLRFLAYRDIYDLLRLMRSDFVLMEPNDLKLLLTTYRQWDKKSFDTKSYLDKLSHLPAVAKVVQLVAQVADIHNSETENFDRDQNIDLPMLVKKIVEAYHVAALFNQENDIKNLNYFLEITAHFESAIKDYAHTLNGFLNYCDDFEEHESFQQLGLGDINALSLMSIHKSKGLEFENVFFYWNLSAREQHSGGQLHSYLEYDTDFSRVHRYLLTYNFDHLVNECQFHDLGAASEIKEAVEELNNFYVAITRAKTNLVIDLAYKKSEGIEQLLKEISKDERPAVDRILFSAIHRLFAAEFWYTEESIHKAWGRYGNFSVIKEKHAEKTSKDFSFISHYMNMDRYQNLKWDHERENFEQLMNFKTMYLDHRNVDKGNIAHHYLSRIEYGTESERAVAGKQTISHYGNLLHVSEIETLIQKVNLFIDKHPSLFSAEKWSNVFTEFTLFSPKGQEFRLDRMMVDEVNREILIVDFKTGEYYEHDQMTHYIDVVKSLEIVKREKYHVTGQYIKIEI